MAETQARDELPPEWMSEEEIRAEGQAATFGKLVNEGAVPQPKVNTPKPPRPQRVLRGWRPSRQPGGCL